MKFKDLKVGDSVFVVEQKRRWSSDQKMSVQKITKIGRQYGYFYDGYWEQCFCLSDGKSYHKKDCNVRANGYGFDVFASEEEYRLVTSQNDEYERLKKRLSDGWRSVLISLPPEAVQKIHAILDDIGHRKEL